MPQLNIKDSEVHRMAGDLARLDRTSAAAAVKTALAETLERRRQNDAATRLAAVKSFLAELPPWEGDMSSAEMLDEINREWEIANGLDPVR